MQCHRVRRAPLRTVTAGGVSKLEYRKLGAEDIETRVSQLGRGVSETRARSIGNSGAEYRKLGASIDTRLFSNTSTQQLPRQLRLGYASRGPPRVPGSARARLGVRRVPDRCVTSVRAVPDRGVRCETGCQIGVRLRVRRVSDEYQIGVRRV